MQFRNFVKIVSVCTVVLLAGCLSAPERPAPAASEQPATPLSIRVPAVSSFPAVPPRPLAGRYVEVAWGDLPGWQGDDLRDFWVNFVRNCQGLMRQTGNSLTRPNRSPPQVWQPVCAAAMNSATAPKANDSAAIRRFLQAYLMPWQLETADRKIADGMVTGYYEPLVRGSRQRGGAYQWPLYAVPSDLLTIDLASLHPELAGKRVRGKVVGDRVVPYDSRADLAQSNRQPPAIVWIDDPVDNFFLQIQGSGRVLLVDGPGKGQTIRLAYANHNGHPYVSIGRWLANQGEIPLAQTSMQNIRAWAKRNPNRVNEMLNANPAVVFFREEAIEDPSEGPKGAYGIPLGERRSIAVDPSFVPLGTPIYLTTTMPSSSTPLNRLVFAQDTGTAIKGAARTDFFWGFGEDAGALAGRMKQRGQMWLLWPKQAGAPSAQ
jgi:membrane-bound lytic murein transglycosylase A